MPNATDGDCGVEQGWKRHGPTMSAVTVASGKRDKFNIFRKGVKDWCYSWMTAGGVESEDEYSVSKQLLFAYLASPDVLDACDGNQHLIHQISEFIRNYVSPVGPSMCVVDFCDRLTIIISF